MNEVVKDKMAREIMVVNNEKLFKLVDRENKFYEKKENDFEKNILENYEYMIRWEAEVNYEYKQPIPYGVVVDQENRIFVYQRGWAGSNAWDSRLHNKIAFWVWGHIEIEDKDLENPLKDGLVREVEEEINLKDSDIEGVEKIWYINNDSDDVSKVHFGVCYLIKVNNTNVELLDWELDNWEFISLEDLEQKVNSPEYDVEAWSKILFNPIKKLIKRG